MVNKHTRMFFFCYNPKSYPCVLLKTHVSILVRCIRMFFFCYNHAFFMCLIWNVSFLQCMSHYFSHNCKVIFYLYIEAMWKSHLGPKFFFSCVRVYHDKSCFLLFVYIWECVSGGFSEFESYQSNGSTFLRLWKTESFVGNMIII